MNLPFDSKLPIHLLSAVFSNTTATYKFYWLIALVEIAEQDKATILKKELFAKMISNSWYTINYFQLSFGKQDLLQDSVKVLIDLEGLTIDENRDNIQRKLIASKNPETVKILNHFDVNVPHWFLSPWFGGASKKDIYNNSKTFENKCLYALYKEEIIINPEWLEYLKMNANLIKGFCFWNLSLFLQNRNPNVPDIPNKLIKPAIRNSLQKQTKEYWKIVFDELDSIECIFTGNRLSYDEKNFAIDHFVPYAFVSHDLIWNLIPIDKRFNSVKSDKLPSFEKYFERFMKLQKVAFDLHLKNKSKSKFFDEYLTLFSSLNQFDEKSFENTVQSLLLIANNNGFLSLKE